MQKPTSAWTAIVWKHGTEQCACMHASFCAHAGVCACMHASEKESKHACCAGMLCIPCMHASQSPGVAAKEALSPCSWSSTRVWSWAAVSSGTPGCAATTSLHIAQVAVLQRLPHRQKVATLQKWPYRKDGHIGNVVILQRWPHCTVTILHKWPYCKGGHIAHLTIVHMWPYCTCGHIAQHRWSYCAGLMCFHNQPATKILHRLPHWQQVATL